MAQVFVSYSAKDTAQANEIVARLESQGIKCWIAHRNIDISASHLESIPGAIQACPFFLLLLSENARESAWIPRELDEAISQKRMILPLLLEPCTLTDAISFGLRTIQIRPYHQDKEGILHEIVTKILDHALAEPDIDGDTCYRYGHIFFGKKDYDRAIPWLTKAYEKENYPAAATLGSCFYYKKDFDNAVKWYGLAHSHGDPNALANQGLCYSYMDKAHQDWHKAEEIFRRAATEKEHPGAMYYLGEIYENGRTGRIDLREAANWYEKAKNHKDSRGETALERVLKKLS